VQQIAALFDHLVGVDEHRRRHFQSERLGGLEGEDLANTQRRHLFPMLCPDMGMASVLSWASSCHQATRTIRRSGSIMTPKLGVCETGCRPSFSPLMMGV
jgi:hypothetical protein